ncbi:uncharacterized protein ACNLHF_020419 isoform 2-T2 [Anomaloglossus baeobatrachus]|uniref:uncharacterized protein LOC142309901 isoform X2 n=1 Tax=Anomaloglossus baeobatrachus TaxID=238106 RepID=UPI003F501B43
MEPIDLQDDDHRHVKAEEEEVICVKIKEEEISTDVSSDTENNTIFRNLEDEGKDASFNTWEEKMSINTGNFWKTNRDRQGGGPGHPNLLEGQSHLTVDQSPWNHLLRRQRCPWLVFPSTL